MAAENDPGQKAFEQTDERVTPEARGTEEELGLARDLTASFVKTVKAFRFYPPDNPTLKGFSDQMVRKLQFFLGRYHAFALQVGEYSLAYKGRILSEDRDTKTSLAFLLCSDGVRELRFRRGLEDGEAHGLIDVIRRSDHVSKFEDDIVTLLWERDFPHIDYKTTEDFLDEAPVEIPETIGQFRKGLTFMPLAHQVEVGLPGESEEEGGFANPFLFSDGVATAQAPNRSLFALTAEETERLRKEVEGERDPSTVFGTVDILFDIMAVETDPEISRDAVTHLGRILDGHLTLGAFNGAARLLKRVQGALEARDLREGQEEILRRFLDEAGSETRIARIGKILEKETNLSLEAAGGYLALLQRNALRPLIGHLLSETTNSKVRRMLCDAVAGIGRDAVDVITPFLDDPRWYVVRNIVYILGRIGKEQALPFLQRTFSDEDVRVRREVVQALGLIGTPRTAGLLTRALTDGDARIRSTAALNLGKVGKGVGVASLLGVVQGKEFGRRDAAEIQAFFEAIGRTGSAEAVPVLSRLLERKGWFLRGKLGDLRRGAARALAMIPGLEAETAFRSGKESKDDGVREACHEALRDRTSLHPGGQNHHD
jgi:hypothetical protein